MTSAEQTLRKLGWQLSHTSPLTQTYHFDRFMGRRRVAAVVIQAMTTSKAWLELRRTLRESAA